MDLDLSRLRRGELLAGLSAVLLLVALFAFPWYGVPLLETPGVTLTVDGWQAHTVLRWLMVLTAAGGLALAGLTVTQRAPALPVVAATITSGIAAITTVLVAFRVLIDEPGGPNELISIEYGAYVGLLACALVLAGAALSMRDERSIDGSAAAAGGRPPAAP